MKKSASRKKKDNYGLMAFVKFVAFILPIVVYILLTTIVFPAPNSGFLVLGIIGCIAVGLSLANLAGLLDDMYLGNALTLILSGVGAAFIAVSSLVMYVPSIYSKLNEHYVTFYFMVWCVLAVLALYYLFFRHAVVLFLKNDGMSKTKVKETLQGRVNFWWYEAHKKRKGFAWIYHVNKLFFILFLCVLVIHALLGWIKVVFLFVGTATCILALLSLCMYYLVFTTWDFAKSASREASKAKMSAGFLFPLMSLIGIISYLIRIW